MSERLKWFVERAFGSRVFPAILVVMLLVVGVAFASVSVPDTEYPDLVPTADEPWIIEVPSFDWDYYVGLFSNGTVYAVNGSNGDCFLRSSNVSYVSDMVFGNMSAGDKLLYGNGDFSVDDVIGSVPSGVLVEGLGDGSRLYLADGLSGGDEKGMIFELEDVSNVTIRNLCVDGNYLNLAAGELVGDPTGLFVNINIVNCSSVVVEDCLVINGRSFGVSAESGCYDIVVRDNRVIECKANGISFTYNTFNSVMSGNYVEGSCDIGLDLMGDATPTYVTGCLVTGNRVNCSSVESNDYGSSHPTSSFYGVRLEGYSMNNTVSNNLVYNCINSGIADYSTAKGNMIIGNRVFGNATNCYACISVSSNYNSVVDNVVYMGSGMGLDITGDYNSCVGNTIFKDGSGQYGFGLGAGVEYSVFWNNIFPVEMTYPLSDVAVSNCNFSMNFQLNPFELLVPP